MSHENEKYKQNNHLNLQIQYSADINSQISKSSLKEKFKPEEVLENELSRLNEEYSDVL